MCGFTDALKAGGEGMGDTLSKVASAFFGK